jgi:hypothetical protein
MARTEQEEAIEDGVHRMVDFSVTRHNHRRSCAGRFVDERQFDPPIATTFLRSTITNLYSQPTGLAWWTSCDDMRIHVELSLLQWKCQEIKSQTT